MFQAQMPVWRGACVSGSLPSWTSRWRPASWRASCEPSSSSPTPPPHAGRLTHSSTRYTSEGSSYYWFIFYKKCTSSIEYWSHDEHLPPMFNVLSLRIQAVFDTVDLVFIKHNALTKPWLMPFMFNVPPPGVLARRSRAFVGCKYGIMPC